MPVARSRVDLHAHTRRPGKIERVTGERANRPRTNRFSAKAAKVFNIPTIITTVESESFSGFTYPELLDVFAGQKLLERTSMNSWDDQKVRDALAANGRKKVVVSGLWTEVCNNTFALCAMNEGGIPVTECPIGHLAFTNMSALPTCTTSPTGGYMTCASSGERATSGQDYYAASRAPGVARRRTPEAQSVT
ncbi:hypothetical protein PPGU19_081620 (plasmid) [Paraburkholderia sp. PGU19]|nr:hypothetical protein PPGU19_081620 [Paraburkholderia sp. PGU19]